MLKVVRVKKAQSAPSLPNLLFSFSLFTAALMIAVIATYPAFFLFNPFASIDGWRMLFFIFGAIGVMLRSGRGRALARRPLDPGAAPAGRERDDRGAGDLRVVAFVPHDVHRVEGGLRLPPVVGEVERLADLGEHLEGLVYVASRVVCAVSRQASRAFGN